MTKLISNTNFLLGIFAVFFLLSSTSANSAEDVKYYVGAGLGYSSLSKNGDVKFLDPSNTINHNDAILNAEEVDDINNIMSGEFKKSKHEAFNLNLFVGTKINKYFGFEFGYSKSINPPKLKIKEDGVGSFEGKVNQHYFYGDILGYYPITEKTNLIGVLGIARIQYKVRFKSSDSSQDAEDLEVMNLLNDKKSGSSTQIQPRIGVGVGYDISDKVMLRTMLIHQAANIFSTAKKDQFMKHLYTGSTSFNVEVAYFFK